MITGYRIHFLLFTAIIFFFSCDEILDIYPPEIELLSPTEDILTADTVTFLADASDNIGIERVAFKLRDPVSGNNVKNTIYSTPYQLELVDVQTWNQIELEVKAYDDVGNFKLLEKTFLIQSTVESASITVTAPNGGETWETGETETIRWTSVDVPGNIDIELYKGSSFLETIVDETDNDGTYNWDIPGSLESATDYRIKISWVDYTSVYDYSDGSFTINNDESNEENLAVEDVSVSPTSISAGGTVDISFSVSNSGSSNITNAGADVFLSTSSSSYSSGTLLFQGSFPLGIDPGTSDWEASDVGIPSSTDDGTYYLFVVIYYGDDNQTDNYDYTYLTVTSEGGGTSYINVISPNGGEIWEIDTEQTISWSSSGLSNNNVLVELFHNDNWEMLICNCPADWDEYSWTVDSDLDESSNYRVRVAEYNNISIYDIHYSSPDYAAALQDAEKWLSLYIYGSRGLTHELVRHGDFTSISQRSTRFVNESKSPWTLHPLIQMYTREASKVEQMIAHEEIKQFQPGLNNSI